MSRAMVNMVNKMAFDNKGSESKQVPKEHHIIYVLQADN